MMHPTKKGAPRRPTPCLTALLGLVLGIAAMPAQQAPRLQFEKYTLPNGLEVILHQDHAVPWVGFDVMYKVGSADEQPGRTGFAHLFEHIMFMGSQNVPVGAFDQWLEAAGARNNGSTSEDRTEYNIQLPSSALPLALWLDADRMGWLLPTMDQQRLDLQRDVVKNERRQSVDNVPYGRAYETVSAALFPPHHPYHWPVIGSMTDLSAATLEDVKRFFRTYYAPNNASLTIAGDFDPDSAKAWVQRYFGSIPHGPTMPARPTVPDIPLQRDTFLVLEDRVQLPRLFEAWHSVKFFHPDDGVLDILAYVLAGDKNSRLYKRLVYDLQVAQAVNAFQNSARLDGSFWIDILPKPGQTPERMAALVDEELDKVVKDGITPRELTRAQNTIRARFIDRLASDQNMAYQLNLYNYFAGTPDYAQEDEARYDRVTADDVRRVAATYLTKPRVVLTVVPEGKTDLRVQRIVP
jgi:zinc protease